MCKPAYISYKKFLAETGLNDNLHNWTVWVEQYCELVLFDDGEG